MSHYWYIKKWDGSEIRVSPKPETIEFIKQRIANGEGHIITKSTTIAIKDIKEFYESDESVIPTERLVSSGNVLEDAARAFKEPLLNDDEIVCRAVKRRVPRRKWDSFYAKSPTYHMLEEGDSHITMGFWLPTHLVDLHVHEYCTPEESARLSR